MTTPSQHELTVLQFRCDLIEQAARMDWSGWDTTRAIMADYLEEHVLADDLIIRMTRGTWRHVKRGQRKGVVVDTWEATLPVPFLWMATPDRINSLFLNGLVNGDAYLHFWRGTLKVQEPAFTGMGTRMLGVMRFTWMPQRSGPIRYDIGFHRRGFPILWGGPEHPHWRGEDWQEENEMRERFTTALNREFVHIASSKKTLIGGKQ